MKYDGKLFNNVKKPTFTNVSGEEVIYWITLNLLKVLFFLTPIRLTSQNKAAIDTLNNMNIFEISYQSSSWKNKVCSRVQMVKT